LNKRKKTIYITGKDNYKWSTYYDWKHHIKTFRSLGFKTVNNYKKASIIYNIWWNNPELLNTQFRIFKLILNKKLISVVSNNISDYKNEFNKFCKITDFWVCTNEKQIDFLIKKNIKRDKIFLNPFYVNEKIFKFLDKTKKQLADQLEINYNVLKNKYLIGSFQRDSLGKDLSKPKWQKNPDMYIDIFKGIDKKRYLFILAGPRRHYLITQLEKNNVNYIFIGNESYIRNNKDDIKVNTLSLTKINTLYNLIDLYLVVSTSEGGPKAIIESSLTKTPILSTDVGIAKIFLDEFCICNNTNEFVKKIKMLRKNEKICNEVINNNFTNTIKINTYYNFKDRIKNIIKSII